MTRRDVIHGGRFGFAFVKAVVPLTPHMIRITLFSDIIANYPTASAGAHFKMIVPHRGQSVSEFQAFMKAGDVKPAMRTYTIRRVRQSQQEIDVDIVVHGDIGRVGVWAQAAKPGDQIAISRCGSPKLITAGIDRVIAAADMAGFPALAAGLETLSPGIPVHAFVEIPSLNDIQPIELPAGIDICWKVERQGGVHGATVASDIKSLECVTDRTSIFVAGEFSMVSELREYFNSIPNIDKSLVYISSYWKKGDNEQKHATATRALVT